MKAIYYFPLRSIEDRRMAQERNLSKEWALLIDEWHPAWEKHMKLSTELTAHFAQTGVPPEDFLDQLDAAIRKVDELKQRQNALIEELRRGD